MSRVRRVKPSTLAGRKRQAELGQIISSPRTSKEDRGAALEELNLLAPIVGTPIENEDSFPPVSNPKPVRTGTQSLAAWLERLKSPEVKAQMHELDRSIAVDKAKNATDAERAAYLLQSLPNHALNVMATEIVNNIRLGSRCSQTVPLETEVRWMVLHWLGRDSVKFNSVPLRGTRSDILAAVADAYRILAVKDRDEPAWFVRLAESRYQ